jgi:hypothetical protein
VSPIVLISAQALRVLQQVTHAKNRRLDEILTQGVDLHKNEIAKLQDELYLCPFITFTDLLCDMAGSYGSRTRQTIAIMKEITTLTPKLMDPNAAHKCITKLSALFDLTLKIFTET